MPLRSFGHTGGILPLFHLFRVGRWQKYPLSLYLGCSSTPFPYVRGVAVHLFCISGCSGTPQYQNFFAQVSFLGFLVAIRGRGGPPMPSTNSKIFLKRRVNFRPILCCCRQRDYFSSQSRSANDVVSPWEKSALSHNEASRAFVCQMPMAAEALAASLGGVPPNTPTERRI